jgi:hypothetical protein
MPQWPFSWPIASPQNITCVGILVALIGSAVFAVLLPGWLRQMQMPRSHNNERLVNECFASYQLVYIAFYPTLIGLARPDTEHEYITQFMIGFIFLALIFAGYGFYKVYDQERTLRRLHACKGNLPETEVRRLVEDMLSMGFSEARARQVVRDIETNQCEEELDKKTKRKIYGLSIVFAVITFILAIIVAFSPIFPPKT